MSEALRRLGVVSRAYEAKADEYTTVCKELAKADSAYTRAKAVFKVEARFKANPEDKLSDVELETRAHANDEIAALYELYLVLKSTEKSLYEKLRQLKTQNDNGRSAVATEREVDKIHASGSSGAA